MSHHPESENCRVCPLEIIGLFHVPTEPPRAFNPRTLPRLSLPRCVCAHGNAFRLTRPARHLLYMWFAI